MPRKRRGGATLSLTLVAATILSVNGALVYATKAAFPGLDLFPGGGDGQSSAEQPAAEVAQVAQRSGALPAEEVLKAALDEGPGPGAGWVEAAAPGGAVGSPFDYECGVPDGPGPVVSRARGFAQPTVTAAGPQAAAVTVAMRAYSAGVAPVAFEQLRAKIVNCRSASQAFRDGTGVEAMAAWSGRSASLIWRRGDVIAMVSSSAHGQPGSMDQVNGLARAYDQRLTAALASSCVEINSTLADAARSPYADRAAFTGRVVEREVVLTTLPEERVITNPMVEPVPIPAPERAMPTVVLPDRPANPVFPESLPQPVSRPEVPKAPSPAPTATTVPERVEDAQGPGCGWAFTGQAAPAFDPQAAKAALLEAQMQAKTTLEDAWVSSKQAEQDYYFAYAQYEKQVVNFLAYAEQVNKVAAAWNAIQRQRDAYAAAMDAYATAVEARDKFLRDQEAAKVTFEAQVVACQEQTARQARDAEQSRTEQARPGTPSPSPSPTPSPSTSPTPTPSPAPTAQPVPVQQPLLPCPPPRPAILDQPVPAVPVQPTPPPDPRPAGQ